MFEKKRGRSKGLKQENLEAMASNLAKAEATFVAVMQPYHGTAFLVRMLHRHRLPRSRSGDSIKLDQNRNKHNDVKACLSCWLHERHSQWNWPSYLDLICESVRMRSNVKEGMEGKKKRSTDLKEKNNKTNNIKRKQ